MGRDRKSGEELSEAARKMRATEHAEAKPARLHFPPDVDVKAIR
jgi:hypothetical protein